GTPYVVRLAGNLAKDANGHALDGDGDGVGGDDFTFGFTTEPDRSPPAVLYTLPGPGGANESSTGPFVIRFSEAMDRDSTEAAFTYSDGTDLWDGTAGELTWSSARFPDDTVAFNPFANLPFNATITARLNGSLAADRAGFGLDGNGNGTAEGSPLDDYAWSFVTEARDAAPPRVSVSPPNNATEVQETVSIQLTFTEGMNRTTVEDAFTLADPWRTWTKADGLFSWSAGDDRATFTPSTVLSFDRTYTVTLGASAEDRNENPMGAAFVSTFRTRAEPDTLPPHVLSTFPVEGATGVVRDARISVTFDDAMDRDRTEAAIALVRLGGYAPVPVVISDFTWDAGDHTVSFVPLAPLDWEAVHRLTIGPLAKDDAGLTMGQATVITFTTAAWNGRVVGRVVDGDGIVAGAIVRLGDLAAQTDENGTFAFPHAAAGTYTLLVAKPGYATFQRTVTLSHREAGADYAEIDLGDLRLEPIEGIPALAIASGLVAVVAGLLVLVAVLRRLRPPAVDALEEVEDLEEEYEEYAEPER
ncbi:MAG TPA: Ig-like domain-containing protein, partial [Thermoplasmata archaeon]|nr:Ig-like domain-containing protein [Thermoplasmata archaeon]